MRKLRNNQAYDARAREVIAHGALTNSKRPESFVRGVYPTHIYRGIGARVVDVDGNEYVDYICSLGALLFGHGHHAIKNAVISQIGLGTSFSLSSDLEVHYCERLKGMFPYMERMRLLKSGSEACSAAVRIARAATGREKVVSEGYHGWADDFVSLTPPANGVPERDWMESIISLERPLPEYETLPAAVIIEPVITDHSGDRIAHLWKLREWCTKRRVVLIWDETITGLRFPGLSVAKATGIHPDLSIFGKAIGGGLPLAVVGGRKDLMEADYFVSSTFAGDTVAIAAGMAVLDLIQRAENQDHLTNRGRKFRDTFNGLAPDVVRIEGYETRGVFKAEPLTLALFLQEACKGGVLFGPTWFYGTEHHHHDEEVLNLCKGILQRIKAGDVRLEGEMPVRPYAQKVRER